MILREIIAILIACCCVSPVAPAQKVLPSPSTIPPPSIVEHQDFSEIVVPITSAKITPSAKLGLSGKLGPTVDMNANFGTGFCLDVGCRFIVTNYHVAMTSGAGKIKGEKIIHRYLATGPHDEGATANSLPNGDVLPYATSRDLAIFELRRALPHHHGLTFSQDEPQAGQRVDIYGYPAGILNPIRKLTRFPAAFKALTTSGLLAFDYQSDKPIRIRGASGGIVVDRKTEKVVGILSETNETMALAVPVQTLVDFVSKAQPFLAHTVFPTTKDVSPVSADIYPKFEPHPDYNPKFVPIHVDGLQYRPEEPGEVRVLRSKAQLLADSMRNFIAVETYSWGTGDREPAAHAEYEVRVIDSDQRFREHPDGKKELEEVGYPHLNGWVNPSDDWTKLPKMVGTEWRLKVHQAADVVLNGQGMKVFQYYASVEDNLCGFRPIEDFGFFTISKTVETACYGEVWTDEDTNIIRISEHLELSDKLKAYRGWEEYQVVLTYGWLKRAEEAPRLVPLTTFVHGRNGKHVYWCRGLFTDYQIFDSRVRIIAN